MLFYAVIKTEENHINIRACMLLSSQRKVFLSTDKSTAVFPIVLENEEPVYLCFAALLVMASLIIQGDCWSSPIAGRKVIYWNENILVQLGQFFPEPIY